MTDAEVITELTDEQTLAITAWAEARGIPRDNPRSHSPVEEMLAVMCVVRNRRINPLRWRAADASYKAICLAPQQFSCWNQGTGANHELLLDTATALVDVAVVVPPVIRECLYLARGVISGMILDRTGIADSYYAPAAMVPVGRVPAGAVGKITLEIGDQLFYRA